MRVDAMRGESLNSNSSQDPSGFEEPSEFDRLVSWGNAHVDSPSLYSYINDPISWLNAQRDYPEIYTQVDKQDIESFQSQYIEIMKTIDWKDVMRNYSRAYHSKRLSELSINIKLLEACNDALVSYISEKLGIDAINVPKTKFISDTNPNNHCNYNWRNNIITINHARILDLAHLLGKEDDNIQWMTIASIETVLHECWHAFQNSDLPPVNRRELYQINQNNYIPSILDPYGYKTQLVEEEAYDFAASSLSVVIGQIAHRTPNNNQNFANATNVTTNIGE